MNRAEALAHVSKLTTADRNQTHGDPIAQFETAQHLKDELARCPRWPDLNAVEREALEQICTKLSRKVHGDPAHEDTMLDIIGYAAIAVESRHEEVISMEQGIDLSPGGVNFADSDGGAAHIARKFAPRTGLNL